MRGIEHLGRDGVRVRRHGKACIPDLDAFFTEADLDPEGEGLEPVCLVCLGMADGMSIARVWACRYSK